VTSDTLILPAPTYVRNWIDHGTTHELGHQAGYLNEWNEIAFLGQHNYGQSGDSVCIMKYLDNAQITFGTKWRFCWDNDIYNTNSCVDRVYEKVSNDVP